MKATNEAVRPVKIILDTDIGGDCDDAGAMAMLHRLCDLGEAELLAVTHCAASPYVAGCIDAINTYHGRTVPVGINYAAPLPGKGVYAEALSREFPNRFHPETGERAPDTLQVLRKTLADAQDGSVTLVIIGSLASAERLVESGADEISALTGRELIAQKISCTVVMGGRFTGSWPMDIFSGQGKKVLAEWNIKENVRSSRTVCDLWPGKLIFSSYEIGLWCVSMRGYVSAAPKDDPVRRAYELHHLAGDAGRESWDHTAVLQAIRPNAGYWNLHPWGRVTVDDIGVTTWHPEAGGQHTYLLPNMDYDVIRETIDGLVMPK